MYSSCLSKVVFENIKRIVFKLKSHLKRNPWEFI